MSLNILQQKKEQILKFSTKAIHAGQAPEPVTGAVIPPIFQTTTYAQSGPGEYEIYDYTRTANPTRTALETCIASLESGQYGLAFASGMAAMTAILSLLKVGDHIISCDDVYGGSYRLFDGVMRHYGLSTDYVPARNISAYEQAILPNTKMIWVESPTNPLLGLIDIQAVARLAHHYNLLLVVDNTFASPYFQQPLNLGADIVVHSTTKYINGHSDIIGGALVTNDEEIYNSIKFYQNAAGAVPSPFDAWLTLRGIKTLAVRMRQHEENAKAVAAFLANHPRVAKVYYPGLPSHPDHHLAKSQMTGFGGMVSVQFKGSYADVYQAVRRFKVFTLAESLGGVESLVCHPATMTHSYIPADIRESRGLTDTLLRLSIGIEDVEDLILDLEQAFLKAAIQR
jgi:cystathionine beta-lyase/cystathionine gamma-synthase